MPNQYYFYHNPGALLRRFFPKQLNTQTLILIWTVVFILNIVTVVLIQNLAIYKVTDVSKEGLREVSYFENCEIQDVEEISGNSMRPDVYCVTYVNEAGENRVVCLEKFPDSTFYRFRLEASTDSLVDENGMIQYQDGAEMKEVSISEYVELAISPGLLSILILTGRGRTLVGIYMAFGLVMLGVEFFLYSVFHKLFRE